MRRAKKKSWCSWSMCYVHCVMYSYIKWTLGSFHFVWKLLFLKRIFIPCYFSQRVLYRFLWSHSAFASAPSLLLSNEFFLLLLFHLLLLSFSFVHCWECCRCSFHQVSPSRFFFIHSSNGYDFFSLISLAFNSRACFEKMIGACSAVFISRCISASLQAFIRSPVNC